MAMRRVGARGLQLVRVHDAALEKMSGTL